MGNRHACPAELPNAGDLPLSVSYQIGVYGLLRFECSIHAFSWNNRFTLVLKNERRILTVEDQNIDLITEGPFAVHDVRFRSFVALRQIGLKQLDPYEFARISLCPRVS